MKTVLVTGATSGIGLVIASHLHENGFRVYGTSRTPEKHCKALPFEILELEVTSLVSIQHCIDTCLAKAGKIDILVNNAGIAVCGSAEETSLEQAYKQVETNFWGTVKMTRAILPAMRRQRSGRIITIGSLAGIIGVPYQSYYSASKHALEGFFKSLRIEVRPFNIGISLIEPGFFKTNLHNVFEYAAPAIADYDRFRKHALHVFSSSIEHADTPESVARIVVKIVNSQNPGFSYRAGKNSWIAPLLQFACYKLYESGVRGKFRL
ncbi:MAG: SDR family NAD(P)-dependent oxidoreductase [Bacteroidetes bacterium]|nr:SDR family NAD(P)-dependent oxidoreductase [Bacteroidota bacterium]